MQAEDKILVLGIGSEILKDDGIGPKLVRKLQNFLPSSYLDYATSMVGGMETIEIMKGYRKVIIIDGIRTGDNSPGTVYYMKFPLHKNTLHLSNAHDASFDLSVKLARELGMPFPENICIIAIEVKEDRVFGESLSRALQERYSEVFNAIANTIQESLAHYNLEDCHEKI